MMLPGVSFVVPVYNKAPYLKLVIRQIGRQVGDFPKQYIFVDDGSTDGSLEIVRRATAGWTNTIIVSQENRGSANATNRGIAHADQPFIKFVDADDLLADAATLTLLRALHGSVASAAFGILKQYDDESEIDFTVSTDSPRVELLDQPLRLAMRRCIFGPTQTMVRTEAVKVVGGCDERIVHSQEYGLTLRLARRWTFMRVRALIGFHPKDLEGRLSQHPSRQLQRITRQLALFLKDYPDLNPEFKRFACHRAAGRAWLFARRHRCANPLLSPWFWHYLAGRFGFVSDPVSFIEKCCEAFEPEGHG